MQRMRPALPRGFSRRDPVVEADEVEAVNLSGYKSSREKRPF